MSKVVERAPISRYPVPKLEDLPEDIRARMLEVRWPGFRQRRIPGGSHGP